MYYFVYHINTIALYWQEKPTLFMTENKGMDNAPIKIAQWVGVKAQDGNSRWIMITKTIMDVNLNLQNSHSSLPTEKNLSGKRPHRPVANLPVADLRSRRREMLLLKLLNTYISVFFSYTGFLSLLGKC